MHVEYVDALVVEILGSLHDVHRHVRPKCAHRPPHHFGVANNKYAGACGHFTAHKRLDRNFGTNPGRVSHSYCQKYGFFSHVRS